MILDISFELHSAAEGDGVLKNSIVLKNSNTIALFKEYLFSRSTKYGSVFLKWGHDVQLWQPTSSLA